MENRFLTGILSNRPGVCKYIISTLPFFALLDRAAAIIFQYKLFWVVSFQEINKLCLVECRVSAIVLVVRHASRTPWGKRKFKKSSQTAASVLHMPIHEKCRIPNVMVGKSEQHS